MPHVGYRIKDWAKYFEINRTRELKRMLWVPIPNNMDGDGYTELVDHPNGAAHFGAWIAIVEIASRQEKRGELPQGRAGLPQLLARMSRLPATLFDEVIPRLVSIGWLEQYQLDTNIPQEGAGKPHDDAEIPQLGATRARVNRHTGMVGMVEQGGSTHIHPDSFDFEVWSSEVYDRHPKHKFRFQTERALAHRFAEDEAARTLFDQNHKLWCETEDWRKKQGRFAPVLSDRFGNGWISDEGWRFPPNRNGDSPNELDEIRQMIEEKERTGYVSYPGNRQTPN